MEKTIEEIDAILATFNALLAIALAESGALRENFERLDLDQRRDWLELFPFLLTRRPDTYGRLTKPVDPQQPYGAGHAATAVPSTPVVSSR